MASPSIELAWRVVQAAESRKALLDQRALSLRVRRTVPAPALNTTFPSQKASMSPHYRESYEDGQRGGVRPPLPNYGGSPLAVAARHRPPGGFPLLQVSSWLRDDAELPELRECEQDSPFSTALLERSAGGLRKRRPKHPQRVIHQEEEEAMSGDFSVSGVRLGTQRRGGGSRLAPDLNALKAKKAFAAQSPWRHADPAALAEALTIALGQLQQSSWNEAEEELAEESNRTPEIEDTAPSVPQTRPRKLAPVRIQEELIEGSFEDDSPSATWPPGAAKRRTRQAPAKALIIRSKWGAPKESSTRGMSLPGEKAEKPAEKGVEKDKAPTEKRAGPPNEEDRQVAPEKSQSGQSETKTCGERVTYDKAKRPNKPLTLVKSEKSTTGTSSSKSKSRSKAGAKKMVLPFAYCFDDPRYWHVESTEGRACPEFLPENRA